MLNFIRSHKNGTRKAEPPKIHYFVTKHDNNYISVITWHRLNYMQDYMYCTVIVKRIISPPKDSSEQYIGKSPVRLKRFLIRSQTCAGIKFARNTRHLILVMFAMYRDYQNMFSPRLQGYVSSKSINYGSAFAGLVQLKYWHLLSV